MSASPSADEAAAIAAAVERFRAETAPAPRGGEQPPSPWLRAALTEGVSAKSTAQDPKGGSRWPS